MAVIAEHEGIRKLEAILAADVTGYSRLMEEDDEFTVVTLEAYRAVFREKIQAHRGRVVDMAGDSVLAVFEAATGAVRAAFEIQAVLAERNEALPENVCAPDIYRMGQPDHQQIVLGGCLLSPTTRQGQLLSSRSAFVGIQVDSHSLSLLADQHAIR